MQRHHPDKSPDPAAATEHAARIAQAYDVLSQPDKRQSYDAQLLRQQQALQVASLTAQAAQAAARTPSALKRRPSPTTATRWQVRYAWGLIVCIIGSGVLMQVLSRKPLPPSRLEAQGSPLDVSHPVSAGVVPAASGAGERAAGDVPQSIPLFVTQLSITLVPYGVAAQGPVHVLLIPELGLRVGTDNPTRWVQKIEADRPALIQRLMERLSRAAYEELVKPEGDLYLKRLIEDAMCEAIGLDRYPPLSALGTAGPLPRAQLEAVLPQPYSVR